ncbi:MULTISPECIES: hypothetical protein [unclassified Yoonia]|uniref:hypothetical protein n=1 Tax=unclassified Yoonia TaxID=2629118 RepID=UPI002B001DE9|nr:MULTISPECIES: hypothetical protein [unclassified Yoonia]
MEAIYELRQNISETKIKDGAFDLQSLDWNLIGSEVFRNAAFSLETLSVSDYRTLMPFILGAAFDRGEFVADSSFLCEYLLKPFYQFAYRHGGKVSVLGENNAKHEFVPGWVSPALAAFSNLELKLIFKAILEWEMSKSFSDTWSDELLSLKRMAHMAVSGSEASV